jgi:FRG domain
MPVFSEKYISSWDEFDEFVLGQCPNHHWIYRGQANKDWLLDTTIERALRDWDIDLEKATAIEFQTIREFRRRLRDPQYDRIHTDTLFCLALMQHYGGPTRLLDCTYSPYAAAAFALEKGPKKTPVVWCFGGSWLEEESRKKTPHKYLFDQRSDDRHRTDHTFIPLYQLEKAATSPQKVQFVKAENPFHLNERLTAQQGIFLCPADLGVKFEDNLNAMSDWHLASNVVKLHLNLTDPKQFVSNLKRMNLSFAALFPGLEGFTRSIGQLIFHYQKLADDKTGLPPFFSRS